MKRESPTELRKALVLVDAFKKGGIGFVPVPILNEEDRACLVSEADLRLFLLEKEAEAE